MDSPKYAEMGLGRDGPYQIRRQHGSVDRFHNHCAATSNFIQERGSSRLVKKVDFLRWLENHNYQELRDLTMSNQQLWDQIEQLQRENGELILSKISEVNHICSQILAKIDLFSGIATILAPKGILSDQAIEVLRNFYQTPDADQLVWITGDQRLRFGHSGVVMDVDQIYYLPEDLDQLTRSGFLKEEFLNAGRLFKRTRLGQDFSKQLQ
jgi:hypothetical protein